MFSFRINRRDGRMKSIALAVMAAALLAAADAPLSALERDEVNKAEYAEGEPSPAVVLKLQILLDRANFSPGPVDGEEGKNTAIALRAFETAAGLPADGKIDSEAWRKLQNGEDVLAIYTITGDDVKGPFVDSIPDDYSAMAKMKALSYMSPAELLSEKFHMDTELLKTLNPEADFGKAGEEIVVANIGQPAKRKVNRIEVDKAQALVRAYSDNELVSAYPATIGSGSTPSPSGKMEVEGVARNPEYNYDPERLGSKHGNKLLVIPPGPNGPVGTVWIELTKETYGIHGTSTPDAIGREESSGCVRLTNWDAEELAAMVKPGTKVTFLED
jgi:lipoprotein-anchoring transpeptidase ErfK/SrfK